ncbi:DUF4380 domain-containing protein [Larkinella humicola]|uniref:DUF4380 domain-containing protein n=1 Tax=Larkinella humicola TaxID=2607654 RepID=A0A5N1JL97_9BACT|nr:DUF4380 domain-containing protein [Larkinella humicola]KAA9356944.1 DUF4380 domain-containing protein [Larkinella humicola]
MPNQNTDDRVTPEQKNGLYRIQLANLALEINPETGGLITALTIDGANFLTGKDVHPDFWGSTFWPSPQSDWGNTPPPELDHQPYAVSVDNNRVTLVSQKAATLGDVVTKEISGNEPNRSFTIRYTITNGSDQPRRVAPWEVTRVHPGGLTFYPSGSDNRWGNIAGLAEDLEGITWFQHQKTAYPSLHNKFFADGSEGWLAQVKDGILFVKKFPEITANEAAPSEAEIEIYTNQAGTYVEIEQQGRWQELQPGASLTWEVSWFLRRLPDGIKPDLGSQDLVSYVRKLVE